MSPVRHASMIASRPVALMGLDKDDAKESLLPVKISDGDIIKEGGGRHDMLFKAYVIITMTWLWTGYTITVRYTRTTVPKDESIRQHYLNAPKELLKMSVPSVAYAFQNNLDFVALSNLDAGLYQVTTQLKVFTTAIFMMLFLGRRFSATRWAAISLLFCGVAAVQLNNVNDTSVERRGSYFVGITAVLATCVTAGFAGVYFEMMLKGGGNTPFWIRNLQMYSCGIVSASIGCLFSEADAIAKRGFFYGYNAKVCAIVAFLSFGGTYISLVMKYLDNLHKSFASAVSIILVVITSYLIFDDVFIGAYFVVGTAIVVFSVMLYNSVPE
ncbi:putative UDP-galactose/UDP-N-acetylglucosamine transporter srf-3 [Ancylostoma ceylanicum]|uniref:Putative UDP-galactose/UDP-N-acetylglucosamine transporter srf-3 n=1 Tax=Ancylostoma ceylanicum TaxID=53326 RepID=A0A0D6M514_9BILA|nr:putative UDP-galactose/UDP-N-acetylglucosamine transporter srf-3 [Ancylostoma ceylanicum]